MENLAQLIFPNLLKTWCLQWTFSETTKWFRKATSFVAHPGHYGRAKAGAGSELAMCTAAAPKHHPGSTIWEHRGCSGREAENRAKSWLGRFSFLSGPWFLNSEVCFSRQDHKNTNVHFWVFVCMVTRQGSRKNGSLHVSCEWFVGTHVLGTNVRQPKQMKYTLD